VGWASACGGLQPDWWTRQQSEIVGLKMV